MENSNATTELVHRLEQMFTFHPAEGAQPLQYATVRGECLDLAKLIAVLLPDCEEREMAFMRLNEVMFWANAGVARHSGTST